MGQQEWHSFVHICLELFYIDYEQNLVNKRVYFILYFWDGIICNVIIMTSHFVCGKCSKYNRVSLARLTGAVKKYGV